MPEYIVSVLVSGYVSVGVSAPDVMDARTIAGAIVDRELYHYASASEFINGAHVEAVDAREV